MRSLAPLSTASLTRFATLLRPKLPPLRTRMVTVLSPFFYDLGQNRVGIDTDKIAGLKFLDDVQGIEIEIFRIAGNGVTMCLDDGAFAYFQVWPDQGTGAILRPFSI